MDDHTTTTTTSITTNLNDHDNDSTPRSSNVNTIPTHPIFTPAPTLASSRYNRQLLIPSISLPGQAAISRTKILIIGLGGLGSPASLYLAGSGIHTLGLLDHDVVETSNLHRQIVHREDSVHRGLSKVDSALRGCRELNSDVRYVGHEVRLSGESALDVIAAYDIVLDCTDNPATRYLISDCCVLLGKVLVSGAAQRLEGQIVVLNYGMSPDRNVAAAAAASNGNGVVDGTGEVKRGPCYRCVFPVPPSPEMVKGCSEIGILGPVVGTVGTLMATEALRLICRPAEIRKPTMLLYNAWSEDPKGIFRTIGLRGRRTDCIACGDDTVLREEGKKKINASAIREGSMDYELFCGRTEDVNLLADKNRMAAADFLALMTQSHDQGDSKRPSTVVDVREEFEVALGPKISGSINIPISQVRRSAYLSKTDHPDNDLEDLVQRSRTESIIFVCQRGNDSQIAAKMLTDRLAQSQKDDDRPGFIGDVRGGFVDIEKIIHSGS